ncbi:hypothetical protein [Melittangium boletus]|uniref:hypothetical protein n=1 Tax=Melittangium boletus TaxID=83453 RepID=UPI003DA58E28
MSATFRFRPLLLLALLSAGCPRDTGPERLARAQASYQALVEQGVPPSDPRWEAIITEFEGVPRDSPVWPEAEKRIATLKKLHATPLPRRPLSRPGEPDGGSLSLDEHGRPLGQDHAGHDHGPDAPR